MNGSRPAPSSTERPRIAATTRLALRVEPRRYLAVAETRTVSRLLLQRRRSLGVLAVPAVVAGVGELAEAMADHVLGHVDRDVLLAVVDRDRVADERREDHRRPRPGLHDLLLVEPIHLLDPPLEAELDERALLDRTRHLATSLLTCDDAIGRSAVRSAWRGECDTPSRACPTGSWAASPSGTCPRHRRGD